MVVRRHGPPAKRRRLLRQRSVGFSPFLRSLPCRALRPPPRVTLASHGAALPSERSALADHHAKPLPPEASDDDDDEEDEEDSYLDEDEEQDTLQVEVVFDPPRSGDFQGVKLLLRGYLGDRQWDLSGFVDLILQQTKVGSVVKFERPGGEEEDDDDAHAEGVADDDDDDVYAVISALNLGRYAGHQCIKELKKYLIEVCHDDTVKRKLQSMLEGEQAHRTGLLVCERFANFPYKPVPPLYDALFKDISESTQKESTQEIRDSFRFKFYLLVTRVFMKKDASIGNRRSKVSSRKKNRNSNSHKGSCENDEPVIYPKAEDEIFHKLCSLSFTFNFPRKEQLVPPELKNYQLMGLVMLVESSNVPAFQNEVESFLTET